MQFPHLSTLVLAAMISSSALGCKCYNSNGTVNQAKTKSCCNQLKGVYRNNNDCAASSISEHLSNFRSCCGGRSDCDYPKSFETEEKEMDSDAETNTIVVI